MGPLHWQMLLPITSLWPIIFVEGTADSLRWAHCISGCCCRWLQFGLLFSGRHCQCTQMGPLHWQVFLLFGFFWPYDFFEGQLMHFNGAPYIWKNAVHLFAFVPLIF